MKRFTIDIDDQFEKTLTDLAQGGSKAEVIRKAIATYKYLKAETADPEAGKRLAITDPEGRIENHIILP